MPTQKEAIEDLNWISGRVSERIWTIAIGVLAFGLTFIVESLSSIKEPFLAPVQVVGPMVLALGSLVFDLSQYIASYHLTRHLLAEMDKLGLAERSFDHSALAFRVRVFSYWVKVALCFAAAIWLILAVSMRTASLIW